MNNQFVLAVTAMLALPMSAIANQPLPQIDVSPSTQTHNSCSADQGDGSDGAGQCAATTGLQMKKHTDEAMRKKLSDASPIDHPGTVTKPEAPVVDTGAADQGDESADGNDPQSSGSEGVEEGSTDEPTVIEPDAGAVTPQEEAGDDEHEDELTKGEGSSSDRGDDHSAATEPTGGEEQTGPVDNGGGQQGTGDEPSETQAGTDTGFSGAGPAANNDDDEQDDKSNGTGNSGYGVGNGGGDGSNAGGASDGSSSNDQGNASGNGTGNSGNGVGNGGGDGSNGVGAGAGKSGNDQGNSGGNGTGNSGNGVGNGGGDGSNAGGAGAGKSGAGQGGSGKSKTM